MDLHDYTIKQDCPECGSVELGADAFEGASYTRDGRLTTRFTCPRCGMHLVAAYKVGEDVATLMTGAAFDAIGERAEESMSHAPMEDGRAQTYNPHAVPDPIDETAGQPAVPVADAGAAEPGDAAENRAAQDPAAESTPAPNSSEGQEAPGLTINYLPMSSNRLMTFDIRFGSAPESRPQPPQEDASPVEYSPSEEDKARLEYFHRQLEELDTVDEAIDEIDNGYNLSDDTDGNDDSPR